MSVVLEVKSLRTEFRLRDPTVAAVDDVSFQVEEGVRDRRARSSGPARLACPRGRARGGASRALLPGEGVSGLLSRPGLLLGAKWDRSRQSPMSGSRFGAIRHSVWSENPDAARPPSGGCWSHWNQSAADRPASMMSWTAVLGIDRGAHRQRCAVTIVEVSVLGGLLGGLRCKT